MSDVNKHNKRNNLSSNDNNSEQNENVCRDFLRNVCSRGKFCKYKHPVGNEKEAENFSKREHVFCHDFQNMECTRPNCKFLHCTKQEEERFRATGYLPNIVLENMNSRGIVNPFAFTSYTGVPLCKDYLKGECRRAGRCKFRHVSEYELEMENKQDNMRIGWDNYDMNTSYDGFDEYEPPAKRHAYESSFPDHSFPLEDRPMMTSEHYHMLEEENAMPMITSEHYRMLEEENAMPMITSEHYRMLEEENAMLRLKVEELEKQVLHLTATNEYPY